MPTYWVMIAALDSLFFSLRLLMYINLLNTEETFDLGTDGPIGPSGTELPRVTQLPLSRQRLVFFFFFPLPSPPL